MGFSAIPPLSHLDSRSAFLTKHARALAPPPTLSSNRRCIHHRPRFFLSLLIYPFRMWVASYFFRLHFYDYLFQVPSGSHGVLALLFFSALPLKRLITVLPFLFFSFKIFPRLSPSFPSFFLALLHFSLFGLFRPSSQKNRIFLIFYLSMRDDTIPHALHFFPFVGGSTPCVLRGPHSFPKVRTCIYGPLNRIRPVLLSP